MPVAETELSYSDPFQLIVAVILSAQCTDKRVNMITPALFERFPDARSMAAATQEELYDIIKSCSYPNNKAKHLRGMAEMIVTRFGGVVPSDRDELTQLPGVGRKTANVHLFCRLEQSGNCCRHSCLQGCSPHRSHSGCQDPAAGRAEADKAYTRGAKAAGTSLAAASRTIHLHCTQAGMQQVWHIRVVCLLSERDTTESIILDADYRLKTETTIFTTVNHHFRNR